jgi:SAM-dependent methyltransferase
MAHRRDRNLALHAEVVDEPRATGIIDGKTRITPIKRRVDNRVYRGFEMTGGTSFLLRSPFRWYPFRTLPYYTGWEITAAQPQEATGLTLRVTLVERATETVSEAFPVGNRLQPVKLPRIFGGPQSRAQLDMHVFVEGESTKSAFLAVHAVLERKDLLQLCRGRGVELGPGPSPQVLPGNDVDVTYVEIATAEQWESLYNQKGNLKIDAALWKRYVRGAAHPLPVEDGSLDFVFTSHVFEHLANPLGHLEHWRHKLRPGGVIAAVVPDIGGSKDYVFSPSSFAELIEEWRAGAMEPQLRHFERWAAVRAPKQSAKEVMDLQRSIHVHYYTHSNIHELLELAVAQMGFTRYDLRYVPNHKDFYFALWK